MDEGCTRRVFPAVVPWSDVVTRNPDYSATKRGRPWVEFDSIENRIPVEVLRRIAPRFFRLEWRNRWLACR